MLAEFDQIRIIEEGMPNVLNIFNVPIFLTVRATPISRNLHVGPTTVAIPAN